MGKIIITENEKNEILNLYNLKEQNYGVTQTNWSNQNQAKQQLGKNVNQKGSSPCPSGKKRINKQQWDLIVKKYGIGTLNFKASLHPNLPMSVTFDTNGISKECVGNDYVTSSEGFNFEKVTIEQLSEAFRNILSGTGGTIAQILLDVIGAAAVNMIAWGFLVISDIYLWVKNKTLNAFNLIMDIFGLITTGLASAIFKPLKSMFRGGETISQVISKLKTTKSWTYISKILKAIKTYGSTITQGISNAISKIIKLIPSLGPKLTPVKNVVNRVGGVLTKIDEATIKVTGTGVKKQVKDFTKKQAKDYAKSNAVTYVADFLTRG
jgi:hypothetical protein